jgi:DNA-binding GntR family transcriptional regulator
MNKKRKSKPGSKDLARKAYMGIRRMLFLNEIAPGQKIHYRDLSDELGMSQTPVIQALRWLEFQGLVRYEANRGFYLEPISLEEINEIYDLREIIEPALLSIAIDKLDKNGIKRLEASLDEYDEAIRQKYTKQIFLAAMNFHLTLASLTGPVGEKIIRDLFDLLYLKYKVDLLVPRPIERVDRVHKEILKAMVARDREGAKKLLLQDVREVREHIIDGIRKSIEEKESLVF